MNTAAGTIQADTPATILVYDTETTGLPDVRSPSDAPHQPHITQIAALLTDGAGAKLASIDLLVRPDGWTIPVEIQRLTGITMDRALQGGVAEPVALAAFAALWRRADVRVAHNERFDARILSIAFNRFGICDPDLWKAGRAECTQALASPLMRLPPTDRMVVAGHGRKPKPPKLAEAYEHFTGKPMTGAHNAAADVLACKHVYFAILRQTAGAPAPTAAPAPANPSRAADLAEAV